MFLFSFLTPFLLLLISSPLAVWTAPSFAGRADATATATPGCPSIQNRQEWRTLTTAQKKEYINAVLCLQKLPGVTAFTGVKTRFDDFQALHVSLTPVIHSVGQFHPWHGRFLQLYETTLRNQCAYKGAQPYWDWSKDVDATGSIKTSPVFDPTTGFGGNGAFVDGWQGLFGNLSFVPGSGGGCITDGPFKSYNLSIGPGTLVTNHCIVRAINDEASLTLTSTSVANATIQPTFELFRQETGGAFRPPPFKLHDGGHVGVNGEMGNVFSSPGDPLFYLHHANMDRIWWNWQAKSLATRLSDISGPTTFEGATQVTLALGLLISTIGETLPIKSVMDIRASPMCYTYS